MKLNRPSGRWSLPLVQRRIQLSDLMNALLLLAVIALVLELFPSNYYMLLPGDARSVDPMLSIKGYPPVHGHGGLYMTDVTVYKVDHKLEELYGRLNPQADLEPTQAVSGGLSQRQYLHLNAQLMTNSIQEAEVAALTALGRYKITCAASKPQIQGVLPHTPAARVLRPGDVIAAVDGQAVCSTTQTFPLVRRFRPGRVLHLTILRGNKPVSVAVRTVAARRTRTGLQPDPHGATPIIGVSLQDVLLPGSIHLPVKIHINPGNTVGPSAGLMFTLAIIERLERRDIARGCKVAGTGTVDYNGVVGPIGGAKQKIIAARGAGAQYFLVPTEPDNLGPARANRGSIRVIPVRSVRAALQALSRIGPCP